ncbi:MAG: hypothetical protein JWQ96_54 [Segetibacter sp.]|nr:hypothetical protein [Segetibacter sp.]
MKAILITAAIVGAVAAALIVYYTEDISGSDKDLDELADETTNAFDSMERNFERVRLHPRESFT